MRSPSVIPHSGWVNQRRFPRTTSFWVSNTSGDGQSVAMFDHSHSIKMFYCVQMKFPTFQFASITFCSACGHYGDVFVFIPCHLHSLPSGTVLSFELPTKAAVKVRLTQLKKVELETTWGPFQPQLFYDRI